MDYTKTYAEENNLIKQPQQMLTSSFNSINGTLITPLFNFYLNLVLQCTKIHRFVHYTPRNFFNSFVQSVVDARCAEDENTLSGVVNNKMKLLGNSSYGYQTMTRFKYIMTKYLGAGKTQKTTSNRLFKGLNFVAEVLFEVEHVKSVKEHREAIIVGFFKLQCAQMRMFELYHNFFDKF